MNKPQNKKEPPSLIFKLLFLFFWRGGGAKRECNHDVWIIHVCGTSSSSSSKRDSLGVANRTVFRYVDVDSKSLSTIGYMPMCGGYFWSGIRKGGGGRDEFWHSIMNIHYTCPRYAVRSCKFYPIIDGSKQ